MKAGDLASIVVRAVCIAARWTVARRRLTYLASQYNLNRFKPRQRKPPVDFNKSQWMMMLQDEGLRQPDSAVSKKFRRRFRVPYPVYLDLLDKTEMELGFTRRPLDFLGTQGVPLELQVLGVLRVLGRGTCFDGIEELSLADEETHRVFFHRWTKKFSDKYFTTYIHPPRNAEELARAIDIYTRMGLPGAMGSVDVVHVRWDKCPVTLTNICKGKEGYPSLGYECTVDHHLKYIAVTRGYYGTYTDKTIVQYDKFVSDLHENKYELGRDYEFTLYDKEGNPSTEKGAYLICDGGYLAWRILMTGFKYYTTWAEALWSALMESCRKDVERSFGILKGRFRCLKLPIEFHTQDRIDNMFWSCCILHNMLLSYDGRDMLWQEEEWLGEDGNHDVGEDDDYVPKRNKLKKRAWKKLTDYAYIGRRSYRDPQEHIVEGAFYELRNKLTEHYDYMSTHRERMLEWLH